MIYIIFLQCSYAPLATSLPYINTKIMEKENLHTAFSRSMMSGLFAGVSATVVSLFYNSVYRGLTDFPLSAIINVSSIIFAVPIVLLLAGMLHYVLNKFRSGNLVYIFLFLFLTGLCVLLVLHARRSPDAVVNSEFRQLLLGIVIISGLSSLFVPWLSSHENGII